MWNSCVYSASQSVKCDMLSFPYLEGNVTCVLRSPLCLGKGSFPNLCFEKCGYFPGFADHRDCAYVKYSLFCSISVAEAGLYTFITSYKTNIKQDRNQREK